MDDRAGICQLMTMKSNDFKFIKKIEEQPTVNNWILCSKQMPEEYDTIFAKWKGTDKWREGMFAKKSDDVNVTVEYEDGTRKAKISCTRDGKWRCEKEYETKTKVIAWKPFLELYEGE